jgi:hypothetical protein
MIYQSAYVFIYLFWSVVWQLVRIYILGDFIIPGKILQGLDGWTFGVPTIVVVVNALISLCFH